MGRSPLAPRAASTCAVVWTVSGYDALVAQFDDDTDAFLGRYDLLIAPLADSLGTSGTIRPELVEALAREPNVREVQPLVQSRASVTPVSTSGRRENALGLLVGDRPPVSGAPPVDPLLVGTDAAAAPNELLAGVWLSPDPTRNEAVLSRGAADRLQVAVGDEIDVTSIANRARLQVIGIVEQSSQAPEFEPPRGRPGRQPGARQAPPAAASETARPPATPTEPSDGPPVSGIGIPLAMVNAPATNAVYVRIPLAARINGHQALASVLRVALRQGTTTETFHATWDERLSRESPPLTAVDFDSVRTAMESTREVSGKKSQAYAATALASLVAVLIIFTTLSMGVGERSREFALLRAIGLARAQIGSIIVVESILFAVIGWVGGLAAGSIVLVLAGTAAGDSAVSAKLGWTCIALSGASVLVGAIAAAALPAWRAMRIRPLEVTAELARPESRRWPYVCLAFGLVLIAAAPLSVFALPLDTAARLALYAAVSYPSLLVGMVLITPACVIACGRFLAPFAARLLALDPILLRSQLDTNLARTVGATLALASGLAIFAWTQIWGSTMLQFYIPGRWLPDAIAAFHPLGVTEAEIPRIAKTAGIQGRKVLPLAVEQAKFAWSADAAPAGLRQDNAVVIGLDARRALGGEDPFLELEFTRGNPSKVMQHFREDRLCIVSEDFVTLTGLGIGDRIPFSVPSDPAKIVDYEIGAVVSLPGWQWFTKFSGPPAPPFSVVPPGVYRPELPPATPFCTRSSADSHFDPSVSPQGIQKHSFALNRVQFSGFSPARSYYY